MTIFRLTTLAVFLALVGLATPSVGLKAIPAPAPPPAEPGDLEAAFERLKTLVGTWDEEGEYGRVVEYHLTGRGSALIEEFIGDPPMASVYHLDGPDLRLTHYCNAGNQPRMRVASYDPDTGTLGFEFVDVTNLSAPNAYHTRDLTIRFVDDDHVVLSFVGLRNGEQVPGDVSLRRRTEAEASRPASTESNEKGASGVSNLDAEAIFDRMKKVLVGEWEGRFVESGSLVEATFYLTGNESALVEEIRRASKPASRMLTVYHLADEQLQLTHYCSYRNQPRLIASSVRDDGRTIEFKLIDVTNLSRSGNRYTHKMIVSLPDEDHASITFVGLDDGQEGALTTELTRVR